jgi:hypothetical protein
LNRKVSPGVIQAQSGGATAGVGLLSGWGVISLQKSRRWDGLQKRRDGQRKDISVKENPKGWQTWARSHCPPQRVEASLISPTSIASVERP